MSQTRSSSVRSYSSHAQVSKSYSTSGAAAGCGFKGHGGGISQAYGQSLKASGLHGSAGIGVGSGSGIGLGAVSGRSISSGLKIAGGSISAAGGLAGGSVSAAGGSVSAAGDSVSAAFKSGGGSFMENMANIVNDKQQLQVLNDRLATYLEKVKRLEFTNRELNEKLRSFTLKRVQTTHDFEPYQMQIRSLREQILTVIQENTNITLSIDNAKLAAEDFRLKYETELGIRQSVEADITNLKALKKEYETTYDVLQHELGVLTSELENVKDSYQQEMIGLRGQISGTVTVDVQEVESTDLAQVLSEIRSEYEMVIEKNRREAEQWYTKQLEKKTAEVAIVTETTVTGGTEITESRKQMSGLQTQYDSIFVEKTNLEQRLMEVQGHYQVQLFKLSHLAGSLEGELMSIRESAIQQSRDYQLLLSTKVQLEREINTYRALLEGAADVSVLAIKPQAVEIKESVEFSASSVKTETVAVGGANATFLISDASGDLPVLTDITPAKDADK